jgi:hypothetical protein
MRFVIGGEPSSGIVERLQSTPPRGCSMDGQRVH